MLAPVSRWLIRSQFPAHGLLSGDERRTVSAAVEHHIQRVRRLAPAHVRLGLLAAELLFGLVLVATFLPDAEGTRARRILTKSGIGPVGALIRFYGVMTALVTYEHPSVIAALGLPPPEQHANAMRALRARGS